MLMAHPSRVATRLGIRSLAGAAVLSVVLAFTPTLTVAQSTGVGGNLGFDTPALAAGSYGRVATDDGGGLLLRAGAGQDYEYITELGDGDVVQVLDGPLPMTAATAGISSPMGPPRPMPTPGS